jgi:hypothetical protein
MQYSNDMQKALYFSSIVISCERALVPLLL